MHPATARAPADDERSNVASIFVQADDFSGAAEVGSCFVPRTARYLAAKGFSDDAIAAAIADGHGERLG